MNVHSSSSLIASRRLAIAGLVVSALSVGGCSVLQPVGDFFSQGYRNTVSYFNAYYNASRLFEAAVDEIALAKRAQRSAPTAQPAMPTGVPAPTIPASARQKLNSVIDKCSNILAFHEKSDYVDDALMLIARSYFLQGEFVKAERKCTELLAQYPSSDLTNEARILYGQTVAELSRPEEAQTILMEGLSAAEADGDEAQQAVALEALSSLRRRQGDPAGALQFATRLRAIAPDDESVAWAMLNEGQLLLEQGQPEAALEPLTSIPQATEEPSIVFEAGLVQVEALRQLGKFDEALTVTGDLSNDLRFRERLGTLALERARLLNDAGRVNEAIAAYDYADTAFARQASAADAAYELGEIYEKQLYDYPTAARKYERSGAAGSFASAVLGKRRSSMFARYFQLHARLSFTDSLRQAAELVPPDSAGVRTNVVAIDSLTTQVAVTMQELGEWFYSELERPDSSGWWLKRSLDMGRTHRNTPRGLYLLADLALSDSTGSLGQRDTLLHQIVRDFRDSPYAAEARKMLGLEAYVAQDPSGRLYREAELAMESGHFQRAVERYDSLVAQFPASSLMAKSLYAAGWTYDNRLDRPDSAASRYQAVVQRFGATEYAEQARRRLTLLSGQKVDSTKTPAPPPTEVQRPAPDRPLPPRDRRGARPAVNDSSRSQVIE